MAATDPTIDDIGSGYTITVGNLPPEPVKFEELFPDHENRSNDTVTPYLIDTSAAWIACFGPLFNNDYILATFETNAYNLGRFYMTLNCGTSAYGWHHIQAAHQSQWQQRLDTANQGTPGGGPAVAWDDLMALATRNVLKNPWWYTVEYSGKRCFTQTIQIRRNSDNAVIFQGSPTVVVSMTNLRVITSYPTTNEDCSRQASWA